jgi:hypothetical protein
MNQTTELNMLMEQAHRAIVNLKTKKIAENSDVFSLGAQLLYYGQKLTEISDYKLEPASLETRVLLTKITQLLEMETIS